MPRRTRFFFCDIGTENFRDSPVESIFAEAPNAKQQDPSPKSQIPGKVQSSSIERSERAIFFEHWGLEFPWDLEFGAWDLTFRCSTNKRATAQGKPPRMMG